ncbi:SDR family oxidoreductase [Flavobacterium anhuiense]|uniref:SDR family oxidoreductase n=1 Tax=Flavobacterium anhuiense TaxID=459526 RepID=UPI003D99CA81
METKKVWFVTGASQGLGLALVKKLLADGYSVAATSRNAASLKDEIPQSVNFLPLEVDITSTESVQHAIDQTVKVFGSLEIVVNNAGFGQLGALEELSHEEARRNFDANVFGVLNVIRSAAPYLRRQQHGHIINVSSIVGFYGEFGGWGVYNATKFAVAGLTEAFSAEMKPFGVKATIVYPGYFRTNFLQSGSLKTPENTVEGYTALRASEKAHIEDIAGSQPGSPEKAAIAIADLAQNENPPLHLFLGSDSFGLANAKVEILQKAIADNQAVSHSTDF